MTTFTCSDHTTQDQCELYSFVRNNGYISPCNWLGRVCGASFNERYHQRTCDPTQPSEPPPPPPARPARIGGASRPPPSSPAVSPPPPPTPMLPPLRSVAAEVTNSAETLNNAPADNAVTERERLLETLLQSAGGAGVGGSGGESTGNGGGVGSPIDNPSVEARRAAAAAELLPAAREVLSVRAEVSQTAAQAAVALAAMALPAAGAAPPPSSSPPSADGGAPISTASTASLVLDVLSSALESAPSAVGRSVGDVLHMLASVRAADAAGPSRLISSSIELVMMEAEVASRGGEGVGGGSGGSDAGSTPPRRLCVDQSLPNLGLATNICATPRYESGDSGRSGDGASRQSRSLQAPSSVDRAVATFVAYDTVSNYSRRLRGSESEGASDAAIPGSSRPANNESRAISQLMVAFANHSELLVPAWSPRCNGGGDGDGAAGDDCGAQLVSGVSSLDVEFAEPVTGARPSALMMNATVTPGAAVAELRKGGGFCSRDVDCNAGGHLFNVCCARMCACATSYWGEHCEFHMQCTSMASGGGGSAGAGGQSGRTDNEEETWSASSCRTQLLWDGGRVEPRFVDGRDSSEQRPVLQAVSCACEEQLGEQIELQPGRRIAVQINWDENWRRWVPNSEMRWRGEHWLGTHFLPFWDCEAAAAADSIRADDVASACRGRLSGLWALAAMLLLLCGPMWIAHRADCRLLYLARPPKWMDHHDPDAHGACDQCGALGGLVRLLRRFWLQLRLRHSFLRIFYTAPGFTQFTRLQLVASFYIDRLLSACVIISFMPSGPTLFHYQSPQCFKEQGISVAFISAFLGVTGAAFGRSLQKRGNARASWGKPFADPTRSSNKSNRSTPNSRGTTPASSPRRKHVATPPPSPPSPAPPSVEMEASQHMTSSTGVCLEETQWAESSLIARGRRRSDETQGSELRGAASAGCGRVSNAASQGRRSMVRISLGGRLSPVMAPSERESNWASHSERDSRRTWTHVDIAELFELRPSSAGPPPPEMPPPPPSTRASLDELPDTGDGAQDDTPDAPCEPQPTVPATVGVRAQGGGNRRRHAAEMADLSTAICARPHRTFAAPDGSMERLCVWVPPIALHVQPRSGVLGLRVLLRSALPGIIGGPRGAKAEAPRGSLNAGGRLHSFLPIRSVRAAQLGESDVAGPSSSFLHGGFAQRWWRRWTRRWCRPRHELAYLVEIAAADAPPGVLSANTSNTKASAVDELLLMPANVEVRWRNDQIFLFTLSWVANVTTLVGAGSYLLYGLISAIDDVNTTTTSSASTTSVNGAFWRSIGMAYLQSVCVVLLGKDPFLAFVVACLPAQTDACLIQRPRLRRLANKLGGTLYHYGA